MSTCQQRAVLGTRSRSRRQSPASVTARLRTRLPGGGTPRRERIGRQFVRRVKSSLVYIQHKAQVLLARGDTTEFKMTLRVGCRQIDLAVRQSAESKSSLQIGQKSFAYEIGRE